MTGEASSQDVMRRNCVYEVIDITKGNGILSEAVTVNGYGLFIDVIGPNRFKSQVIRRNPKATDSGKQLNRPKPFRRDVVRLYRERSNGRCCGNSLAELPPRHLLASSLFDNHLS